MSFSLWLGYLVACIIIAITPGPGAVASMSTGVRHGYWPALALILGLQTALVLQVAIVALGLGALLVASEAAFEVIKFIGAAYLVWLGIQKWRSSPAGIDAMPLPQSQHGLYLQGLLVNFTNPKAIIFIAALVPQFVDPSAPQAVQYAVIAATLCATDLVVMSCYALAGVRVGRWLQNPGAQRLQNRFFGSLFILAGGLLAASRHSR